MAVDNSPDEAAGHDAVGAAAARLVRLALKAALATLDRDDGGPYASLVLVATAPDASPVLLLSGLAQHTRNLAADPRASLMFDGTDGMGDPMAGGRVSLMGRVHAVTEPNARRRFLARHPSAAGYADFADFAFFAFAIERVHLIRGFGRIDNLAPARVLTPVAGAADLVAGEADLLEHYRETSFNILVPGIPRQPEAAGPWRLAGIDPGGLDLVAGAQAMRINFPSIAMTCIDVHATIRGLLATADKSRSGRL